MGNSDSFLVNAILLFYAIQAPLQGWRLRVRYLAVVAIALLSLSSNLTGLQGDTAEARRGTLMDETHPMSSYVPCRYFSEEGG